MKRIGVENRCRRRRRKPTYALYPVREKRRIWFRNGANPKPGILVWESESVANHWLKISDVALFGLCGAMKMAKKRKRYESEVA